MLRYVYQSGQTLSIWTDVVTPGLTFSKNKSLSYELNLSSWAGFFAGLIARYLLRSARFRAFGAPVYRKSATGLRPKRFSPKLRAAGPSASTIFSQSTRPPLSSSAQIAKGRSFWVSRSGPILDFKIDFVFCVPLCHSGQSL